MIYNMKSRFTGDVTDKPRQEYPRPQFKRESYLNINGIWNYTIQGKDRVSNGFDGAILVPFSPETLLSGVMTTVYPEDTLFYHKRFDIPIDFIKNKTFLNFEAVDYECTVTVNGKTAGCHRGGFLPFSIDVSDLIKPGENTVEVIVKDPTDTSFGGRGKQVLKPGTIWYPPQSGIWDTVWLESVEDGYIEDITLIPDIDDDQLKLTVKTDSPVFSYRIFDPVTGETKKEDKNLMANTMVLIPLENYEVWSPENPVLYNMEIRTDSDLIETYFGMRKFSVGTHKGIRRLFLNNRPYFHNGVLDQGYWSDGGLTAPTDEALLYDLEMVKAMGFNMVRKHIKIETRRFYYYCDKLGLLVWQDIVNGGGKYNPLVIGILPFLHVMLKDNKYGLFSRENPEGREEYETDLYETVKVLKNTVSLAMWVPFNEGWGQFDSDRIAEKLESLDNTRTIDRVSGWHDQGSGDFISQHIYFTPIKVPDDERCFLLSEYGGLSSPTPQHTTKGLPFGYRLYFSKESLEKAFKKLIEEKIEGNIDKGLSAAVYTQVSDVEGEINGLVTYDRMVEKMDRDFVKSLNDKCRIEE